MKLVCAQLGCGTVIQMSDDSDREALQSLMDEHVRKQHSTAETRNEDILNECRDTFALLASGRRITPVQARVLHNKISDLISKPKI